MKTLLALLATTLLMGCTPTPEEAKTKEQELTEYYEQYVRKHGVEICIRGVKHLYIMNGSASHTIVLVDPQTSRVLQCKGPE